MHDSDTILRARKILVIAPHPDDESLGCGGLIAKLAAQGATVHTVFVTDGGASHPGSRIWPRARLAACREQEAATALEQLGLGTHERTFFRLHDAAMPARHSRPWREAHDQMVAILRAFDPDLLLVPWRRDPHCDHRDSWRLVSDALAATEITPLVLEYAIWLDEFGSAADHPQSGEAERVVIDVAREREKKRAAVAAHLSQTGGLIDDDPAGFCLSEATIERLCGATEMYWHAAW